MKNISEKNGIKLGKHALSKKPLFFDINKRANGSIAILGTSGSGKSFATKIMLKRWLEKGIYEEVPAVFVIDPMNEYYPIRKYFGLKGKHVRKMRGLDPFKIMSDAGKFLAYLADPNKGKIAEKILQEAKDSESVDGLRSKLSGDALTAMDKIIKLSDGIFGGKLNVKPGIYTLGGAYYNNDGDKILLTCALYGIWNKISTMPNNRVKILIIDEAWMLECIPACRSMLELFIRMGRKLNLKLLCISQNPADFLISQNGLMDNFDTKILMKLDKNSLITAKNLLGINSKEVKVLRDLTTGVGYLRTQDHYEPVIFMGTKKEKKYFDIGYVKL